METSQEDLNAVIKLSVFYGDFTGRPQCNLKAKCFFMETSQEDISAITQSRNGVHIKTRIFSGSKTPSQNVLNLSGLFYTTAKETIHYQLCTGELSVFTITLNNTTKVNIIYCILFPTLSYEISFKFKRYKFTEKSRKTKFNNTCFNRFVCKTLQIE